MQKEQIPLLRINDYSEEIPVTVVASTDETSYVALSHVWADGLGNPNATALPRCQLLRMRKLIKDLNKPIASEDPKHPAEMLLWCDTLCCPVKSMEAKRTALRLMYRTYEEASAVLVLDRGLISHVSGMSVDEACLRIATSRWMTRLWTLQEGALPSRKGNLWFQFRDSARPAWELLHHLVDVRKSDIQMRDIADSILGRFHIFLSLFDFLRPDIWGTCLEDIIRGLSYRSVTIPSDEPLIIATLLDLDLSEILRTESAAQRMEILWRQIAGPPVGVTKQILFHMGPKIHQPGLRWAPQSLLCVDRHWLVPEAGTKGDRSFLNPDSDVGGLVAELAGFRLSIAEPAKGLPEQLSKFDTVPVSYSMFLRDRQGRWYLLKHRLPKTQNRPTDLKLLAAFISRLSRSWIIYCGSSSLIPEYSKVYRGLLVQQVHEQQSLSKDMVYVEAKSLIIFAHVPTELNQILQRAYTLAQELAETAAGRRLAEFDDTIINLRGNSRYQEDSQAVELELKRLSRGPTAVEALAASGNNIDERGMTMIDEYTELIFRGGYAQIDEYAPGNSKWCVD